MIPLVSIFPRKYATASRRRSKKLQNNAIMVTSALSSVLLMLCCIHTVLRCIGGVMLCCTVNRARCSGLEHYRALHVGWMVYLDKYCIHYRAKQKVKSLKCIMG